MIVSAVSPLVGTALAGLVVGVATGIAVSWCVGYLREAGRYAHVQRRDRKEREHQEREAAAAAHAAATTAAAAVQAMAERIARLEHERVGATFLSRTGRDEPCAVLTVKRLLGKNPEVDDVAVARTPVGGQDAPDDWLPEVSMKWSDLDASHAVQRHRTTWYERLPDDAHGWLEYERITPEEAKKWTSEVTPGGC